MKFSNEIKDYKQNFKKDRKSKMILLGGLFSFLGVILIKTIIRPQYFHLSTLGTFLQGTLPNFFAATGFCAVVFIFQE